VEGLVVKLLAEEGTRVERGSPLARLRTTNLEIRLRAAQGQLKEADARRSRAERVLNRARELFDQELISTNEFDDAMADFNAWDGRVIQLAAEIERIELDLERCTIRSPIAGVVVAEHIEVGGWIGVGDPVMDVIATENLDIRVELPERYFHLLTGEESAVVHVNPTLEIPAELSAIIPLADSRSRVFPIKVSIPNKDGRLAAGMLVEVSLPVGTPQSTVIVPKDAVVTRGPAKSVFVIADDNTAREVPVQVGAGVGAWLVVEGEITAGEKVVTRGNERLFAGQAVQGEPLAYELP
jgi:RND family efflux transporter MFP subunit